MLMSWFTQPSSGGFSSYYLYDTVTADFSRTRLELDRVNGEGKTFVSFFKNRAVGFTDQPYAAGRFQPGESPWTIDDVGDLCYRGKALASRPFPDARVFDATTPDSFIHPGSPLTTTPNLPPGIEAKHLALLAGDAMVGGKEGVFTLTSGVEGTDALVEALEQRVCRVLDIDPGDFGEITDTMIVKRLRQQADTLREAATQDDVESVDAALAAAEKLSAAITERIENGLTPDSEFTSAFRAAQEALANARDASGDDVREAVAQIYAAQESLDRAVSQLDSEAYTAMTRELDGFARSVQEARTQSLNWEETAEPYERLTEAKTVEAYLDGLKPGEL